jgi:hypothetical protein
MRRARSVCFTFLYIVVFSLSLSCRYAQGAGEVTYDYTQRFPAGAGLNSAITADLDEDGRPDIAYSRGGSGFDTGDVGILLGKGDGTFDDIAVVPIDFRPLGLQMVDVDNDGILDIVVSVLTDRFSSDRLISVTPGNGDGSFDTSRTTTTPLATFPFSFQLADIDNDDNLDFYFVDRNNAVVIVYPGDGAGSFGTSYSITLSTSIDFATAGDFNADGLTDFVDTSSPLTERLLSVYLADGAGGFVNTQNFPNQGLGRALLVTDLDGDNATDIVAAYHSGKVSILLNQGSGFFSAPDEYLSDEIPRNIAVADIDHNGAQDLVLGHSLTGGNWYVSLLPGNGDGSFGPTIYVPIGGPTSADVADFDRDGHAELVTYDLQAEEIRVVQGNDRGSFGQFLYQATEEGPRVIAKGDLDDDGIPDAVTSERFQLKTRLGTGDGIFDEFSSVGIGSSQPQAAELVDLNGDTNLDLIAATVSSGNSLSVFLGDGNGTLGPVARFLPSTEFPLARDLAIGDVDGDGDTDAVVGVETPGLVQVARNDGLGDFSDSTDIFGVGKPSTIALGDLTGDGLLDLVVGTRIEDPVPSNKILLLNGNGDGSFATPTELFEETLARAITIIDIDQDGSNDLAWADSSDQVSLVFSDGAGGFLPIVNLPAGDGPFDLDFGDLNRDGLLDFTTSNGFDQTISIFTRRSDGNYAARTIPVGQRSDMLELADDDLDGTLDLNTITFRPAGFPPVDHNTITVFLGDLPPEIVSVSALPGTSGPGSVDFEVTVQDLDSNRFSARWDFDGDDRFDRTAEGLTTTYVYPQSGTFDVSVRVYDSEGASALATTTVEVLRIDQLCDTDGNQIIDINDVRAIIAARNQTATFGDPRDADGDGFITALDARQCVLRCANPRCAP